MMAMAPHFVILLAGRVLLGISLGGFWSMAAANAMRLVPEADVPRAIAIIFGASSFASVLAAPLSSYLGNQIGWRLKRTCAQICMDYRSFYPWSQSGLWLTELPQCWQPR